MPPDTARAAEVRSRMSTDVRPPRSEARRHCNRLPRTTPNAALWPPHWHQDARPGPHSWIWPIRVTARGSAFGRPFPRPAAAGPGRVRRSGPLAVPNTSPRPGWNAAPVATPGRVSGAARPDPTARTSRGALAVSRRCRPGCPARDRRRPSVLGASGRGLTDGLCQQKLTVRGRLRRDGLPRTAR